jgi:GNAT acetyltransferase-like protein
VVLVTPALRVRLFEATDADAWDVFVERSVNGTFMHTRRFLGYHPPNRFRDRSLVLLDEGDRWLAVFPAAEVERDGQRLLQSHPGASYGGLVIGDEATPAQLDEMVHLVVAQARDAGFHGIRLRTVEKVFCRRGCDELDVAYFRAGFVTEGRELSSALYLGGASRDELLARWTEMGRRNVRKAERSGVEVRVSDDFTAFWQLLETTLAARHDTHPTHTLDEILRLRERLGDRVQLVAGYLDGRLISGTVLFSFNGIAAHTMYMAQDYEFQQFRSLNLVLFHASELCRDRGQRWLNYGISSEPGTRGLELNHGLFAFKRSCGGEGVVRDSLFLTL